MVRIGIALLTLSFCLAQDPKDKEPEPEPAGNIRTGRKAYDKAVKYTLENLPKARFQAKMVIGWLLLADGRYKAELDSIIEEGKRWDKRRERIQHSKNWYPALAGILIAEYHKFFPKDKNVKAMQEIVDEFVAKQEKTGGWFKWYEGAVKDMPGYPVRDLGILDAMIYGYLLSARKHGCDVPSTTLSKAEQCLDRITGGGGISYGTGQRGGDITGARGGYAMLGLHFTGNRSHKIWTTYAGIIDRCIPKMDRGHHIGGLHGLGLALACHRLGGGHSTQLLNQWLAKLTARQEADGSVYIGDDGADGGEPGLFGGPHASTAAFALIILMQDSKVLKPGRKAKAKGKSGGGGKSPFGRRK